MRRCDFVGVVRDDHRHRDDEILAEVAARIAGNGVGDLTDQVLDILIAGVGFVHAHEQLGHAIVYARSNGVVPPWTANALKKKANAAP